MPDQLDFQPTRSFAYRLVRYTVLPEVRREVESLGDEPFLLRDIAWPIIDRLVSKEQQAIRIPRAQSSGDDSMASIVRFYVNFLAKDISEDSLVDEAINSGDEEAGEFDGWIYAFSFPSIYREKEPSPIKVGKTVGDVDARVAEQVKGSASFEQPVILGRWQAKRIGPTELAIHNVLKARGKWRENAPGREWFDTTKDEVEAIIAFVKM